MHFQSQLGQTKVDFNNQGKNTLHYKQYGEEMGVPVTDEIVSTAKRPSVDDIFSISD